MLKPKGGIIDDMDMLFYYFIHCQCSISILSFIIAALWNNRIKMKERYAAYKYNIVLLFLFLC